MPCFLRLVVYKGNPNEFFTVVYMKRGSTGRKVKDRTVNFTEDDVEEPRNRLRATILAEVVEANDRVLGIDVHGHGDGGGEEEFPLRSKSGFTRASPRRGVSKRDRDDIPW